MNMQNRKIVKIIVVVYLIATLALLLFGYSFQKPEVTQQEFPFTITYSFQGETKTISDTFAVEYVRGAKYLGDASLAWYGCIQEHDRLESDYYHLGEIDGRSFSIDINLEPGYLMGDPKYADSVCQPSGVCLSVDGTDYIVVKDPAELAQLGLSIVNWEYPEPIENTFSFGGISMSGDAVMYTAIIAIAALLACVILVKKDREIVYHGMDKVSIVLNFLIAIVVFPFIFMVSILSEIVAYFSEWQQILYFTPALTVLGIAASVVLRRCGYGKHSLQVQLVGPILFALTVF